MKSNVYQGDESLDRGTQVKSANLGLFLLLVVIERYSLTCGEYVGQVPYQQPLPNRVTVAQQSLELLVEVQILVRQPLS